MSWDTESGAIADKGSYISGDLSLAPQVTNEFSTIDSTTCVLASTWADDYGFYVNMPRPYLIKKLKWQKRPDASATDYAITGLKIAS